MNYFLKYQKEGGLALDLRKRGRQCDPHLRKYKESADTQNLLIFVYKRRMNEGEGVLGGFILAHRRTRLVDWSKLLGGGQLSCNCERRCAYISESWRVRGTERERESVCE